MAPIYVGLPSPEITDGKEHIYTVTNYGGGVRGKPECRGLDRGPTIWNSLPPAPELSQNAFIRALKTHLFSSARHR